jgi:hypothetical protein
MFSFFRDFLHIYCNILTYAELFLYLWNCVFLRMSSCLKKCLALLGAIYICIFSALCFFYYMYLSVNFVHI